MLYGGMAEVVAGKADEAAKNNKTKSTLTLNYLLRTKMKCKKYFTKLMFNIVFLLTSK